MTANRNGPIRLYVPLVNVEGGRDYVNLAIQ